MTLPKFSNTSLHEGLLPSEDAKYKAGYINTKGQVVVPYIYDGTDPFRDGLGIVYKNNFYGAIDKSGKITLPLQFYRLSSFYQGISIASINKKFGIVNKKGEIIVPFVYDFIQHAYLDDDNDLPVDQSVFQVTKTHTVGKRSTKLFGLIDAEGNVLLPPSVDELGFFSEDMAWFKKNNKYGYINKKGQVVIEPTYDIAKQFHEGLAAVSKNNKWGFIDKSGRVVIDFQYTEIAPDDGAKEAGFENGFAIVSTHKPEMGRRRFGYVDKTGKAITPFIFETAHPFSKEGLFTVRLDDNGNPGKSGVLNKDGQPIIPYTDDYIGIFYNGRARIVGEKNGQNAIGYIDEKGKVVIPKTYTKSTDFEEFYSSADYAQVSTSYVSITGQMSNPRFFTIDRNGKVIKPYGFESVSSFRRGVAEAYDTTGEKILALIIDKSYKEETAPIQAAIEPRFTCSAATLQGENETVETEVCTKSAYSFVPLHDVAKVLSKSKAAFDLVADAKTQKLSVQAKTEYTPKGQETKPTNQKTKTATTYPLTLTQNNKPTSVAVISIDTIAYIAIDNIGDLTQVQTEFNAQNHVIRIKSLVEETQTTPQNQQTPKALNNIQEGVYRILPAINTKLAIGISASSLKDGSKAITWNNLNHVKDQEFQIKIVNQQVAFIAKHSNKALTVENKNGSPVTQKSYTAAANQLFTLELKSKDRFMVKTAFGHYFDVSGSSTKPGANLIVWTKNGNANQIFLLEAISKMASKVTGCNPAGQFP